MINYKINERDFKKLGYKFKKVWANNYKAYTKYLDSVFYIICWVKNKEIQYSEWLGYTEKILKFYDDNLEVWNKNNQKLKRPYSAMKIYLDWDNGKIQLMNIEEYYNSLKSEKTFEEYFLKYQNYSKINLFHDRIEELKREIKFLQND